jgi:hypothetical protein
MMPVNPLGESGLVMEAMAPDLLHECVHGNLTRLSLWRNEIHMKTATLMAAMALALGGTSSSAQTVTYDYAKGTNFSTYKSYAWVRGHNLQDELNHQRIVSSIDAQLVGKGLTQVSTSETPDLLVAYHASFDRNVQINAFSSDFGGWRFNSSRTGTARTEEIVTGTLVVDMIDAKTESMLWRGVASRDLDMKASPEKRDKNMKKAAEKLFKNYPPKV